MNINIELFKRYGADRKMKIVMELTEEEVLATSPATVTRIIKEVGSKRYKSRDKELRIGSERRTGNSWNSTFEEVGIYKKKLYVSLYLQYSNTDTSISEDYTTFFTRGDYRGSIEYMDRYGGKQTEYFTYSQNQKAKAMRSILIEYIQRKYYNKNSTENGKD